MAGGNYSDIWSWMELDLCGGEALLWRLRRVRFLTLSTALAAPPHLGVNLVLTGLCMEFMSPLKVTRNSQHQPAVSVCRGWGGGARHPRHVCVCAWSYVHGGV